MTDPFLAGLDQARADYVAGDLNGARAVIGSLDAALTAGWRLSFAALMPPPYFSPYSELIASTTFIPLITCPNGVKPFGSHRFLSLRLMNTCDVRFLLSLNSIATFPREFPCSGVFSHIRLTPHACPLPCSPQ